MYCRNCGKEVNENAAACLNCGADPKKGKAFCPNCGAQTNENQIICTACGVGLSAPKGGQNGEGKSKTLIGILACIPFVTNLGIHYYLFGAKSKFTINLVAFIISCIFILFAGVGFIGFAIIWIVNLIFGIRVLTGKITEDADGNPLV
mgnify:FL=1